MNALDYARTVSRLVSAGRLTEARRTLRRAVRAGLDGGTAAAAERLISAAEHARALRHAAHYSNTAGASVLADYRAGRVVKVGG